MKNSSLIFGLILSCVALFFSIYFFPFWKIPTPINWLTLAFITFPVMVILFLSFGFLVYSSKKIRDKQSSRKKLTTFSLIILTLSNLLLIFRVDNAFKQLNPMNNFNAYLKQREEIVAMIQSGRLKIEKSPDRWRDGVVYLPEKYQGLSYQGKVYIIRASGNLEIRFIHSIGGFGDTIRYLTYSSKGRVSTPNPVKTNKKLKERWFYIVE